MSFQNKNKYFFVIPMLEIFDGTNSERSKNKHYNSSLKY